MKILAVARPLPCDLTEANLAEVTEAALLDTLRVQARDRLLSGTLPRDRTALTRAGVPDGSHRCAVCDAVIAGPIEFCVRSNGTALHFHGRCHDAWLAEREVLETS
jgi:hypothetical protein